MASDLLVQIQKQEVFILTQTIKIGETLAHSSTGIFMLYLMRKNWVILKSRTYGQKMIEMQRLVEQLIIKLCPRKMITSLITLNPGPLLISYYTRRAEML